MSLNNKTKIATTTITAALLIGLMLSPMTIFPKVNAQTLTTQQAIQNIENNLPTPLSAAEHSKVMSIVLKDVGIQNLLKGKQYSELSTDFIGSSNVPPITWYPEIHLNVMNKTQVTVTVDLNNNSVRTIGEYPLQKTHGPINSLNQGKITGAAYAVEYYPTSGSTIKGMYVTATAPVFSSSGLNVFSAFLVNGMEYGADYTKACTNGNQYYNYFAQAGFGFGSTAGHPGYTDTTSNCFLVYPNIAYTPNDSYVFYMTIKSSNNWYIYGVDQTAGGTPFAYTGPVTFNNSMFKTINTSVWFENQNTASNSGWYAQYQTNPKATSYYQDGSGTWRNWDQGTKDDRDCSGGDHGDVVITPGDLINGGQATWNMFQMASHYNC